MLIPYQKPALTFAEQLQHLEQRGLKVIDSCFASRVLSSVSYYRLSAYWYPFRQHKNSSSLNNHFIEGASFEQAYELYEFDRKLRSFVLDAIERVEVAVRTRITYHIGHKYGAFAHVVAKNFHPKFAHSKWLEKLERETERASDKFIAHYKRKYEGFPRIPVWMLTEVISLGSLSFFYTGLNNNKREGIEDKKAVADCFNLHHKRLADWLHTLTYIRNICAHHSRLWNRELAIRPDRIKDAKWQPPLTPCNNRIFYILLMLRYFLKQIGCGDDWAKALTELLLPIANNKVYRNAMGMPEQWKEHPLWK